MTLITRLAAAAAVAIIAGTAQGAVLGSGYTSFFSFGDSLSDPGNLFAATGGTTPASPPYFGGRFSNGPVWAESLAAEFTAQGLASGNFAFGGARAVPDADAIPDLPTQLGIFNASVPAAALGSNPLASLWFGANDLFAAIGTLPTAGVVATAQAAAQAVAAGAASLAGLGIQDFVIFNLPDFGNLPNYALFEPGNVADATAGSDAFNAELDLQVDLLRLLGLNVIEIDAYDLFADLLADPGTFGVADATTPCVIPGFSVCTRAEAAHLAFFDPVHPTAVIHNVIADVVSDALSPVPLPLPAPLLAVALLSLGLLVRRRTV